MRSDMKETLMMIAKGDMGEYEKLKESSIDDFLTRYKLTIEEKIKDE